MGEPVGPRGRARHRSARGLVHDRDRLGRAAAACRATNGEARPGAGQAQPVSFHSTSILRRSAGRAAAASRAAASGSATTRAQQLRELADSRSIVARRTGRCCRSALRAARPLPRPVRVQVELRRALSSSMWRSVSPRSRRSERGSVLQDEHHLEQRGLAGIALGLELLDQPLERQLLVRVGARARPPAPAPAARGRSGRPTGRCAAPAC